MVLHWVRKQKADTDLVLVVLVCHEYYYILYLTYLNFAIFVAFFVSNHYSLAINLLINTSIKDKIKNTLAGNMSYLSGQVVLSNNQCCMFTSHYLMKSTKTRTYYRPT